MRYASRLVPLFLISTLSLSGCLKVEDDTNDDLVESLRQQNEILKNQNDLLAEKDEFTVSFSAVINDTHQDTRVTGSDMRVQVLQGDTVLVDGIEATNGKVTIEDLPPSSDLTLLVTFSDGSYSDRAFFITTPGAPENDVFVDLGVLQVSVPVEISFSMIDGDTGMPLTGLEFSTDSYYGVAKYSTADNYAHTSSFNEETGLYSVTLPRDFSVSLRANIDLDGNGEADFDVVNGSNVNLQNNFLVLYQPVMSDESTYTLYKEEDVVQQEKQITLTLLDENGNVLSGASFYNDENDIDAIYDEAAQVYTLTIPFDGSTRITMPAFSDGESNYRLGTIDFYRTGSSSDAIRRLRVSTSGYESNSYYEITDSESVSLILIASESAAQYGNIETVASFLSTDDYSYSVYYSEPVSLSDDSVMLTYEELEIIPGNASTEDSVPAGYTRLQTSEKDASVSVEVAKNNTQLILTPDAELLGNTVYNYVINELTSIVSGEQVNLSSDDKVFTTSVDANVEFSISDVVLDNANYYSNGALLVAENTAGEANTAIERREPVRLLLPTSIESLNYLVMNLQSYTENDQQYTDYASYEIVLDGNVRYSRYFALDVAENENIIRDSYYNFVKGTTMASGEFRYLLSISMYLNDNKPENANTMTFNYEYQTQAGVTESGTITLPVL